MAETVAIHNAWQKVFDRFDKDRSGLLDVAEIKEGLRILLGTAVSQPKFDACMCKFDMDCSGQLDIKEFGKLINDLQKRSKSYVEPPVLTCQDSILGKGKTLPGQDMTLKIYHNHFVAGFVAFCIIGNFFVNILEKQIDPDTKKLQYGDFWSAADKTFNIIFVVELIANMWSSGGPVKAFWRSGWNVFDTIIVVVGVLTMVDVLGPPLDKLKLMRAFRVFRLFKRVESLNKIIVALISSIPGVINAFVVMLVFFCIYAILAVELFRNFGEGGKYSVFASAGDTFTIDSLSARGYVLGIEYYGTFMRALFTLFQVMTGESWSEAVVRPLLFGLYEKDSGIVVGLFFVSFIILTQIVLINVVVAVLLEKFCANEPGEDEEDVEVDARLQALDSKDEQRDMHAKLDQIVNSFLRLDSLTDSVTELYSAVSELKIEVQDMREASVEQRDSKDGVGRRPAKHPWDAERMPTN